MARRIGRWCILSSPYKARRHETGCTPVLNGALREQDLLTAFTGSSVLTVTTACSPHYPQLPYTMDARLPRTQGGYAENASRQH